MKTVRVANVNVQLNLVKRDHEHRELCSDNETLSSLMRRPVTTPVFFCGLDILALACFDSLLNKSLSGSSHALALGAVLLCACISSFSQVRHSAPERARQQQMEQQVLPIQEVEVVREMC